MSHQEIIELALNDFADGKLLNEAAQQKFASASKRLESILPKKTVSTVLSDMDLLKLFKPKKYNQKKQSQLKQSK